MENQIQNPICKRQFTQARCFSIYLLLMLAAALWPGSAGAATVQATKTCAIVSEPCTVVNASFTIVGTPKIIHWTAVYTGSPSDGHSFYITTNLGDLNQIALTTTGQASGSMQLQPGIYHISINSPLMGPGTYTINYNPATTGDPHLTTINGARYDFQSAGEFVFLRQPGGLEIQVRQTPVSTTPACVSVNSAVAARVGTHRVTYEPNLSGVPDPNGLQLRVDGKLVDLNGRGISLGDRARDTKTNATQGIDLGNRGRISKTAAAGGLRIDFPDGSYLLITPGWWDNQQIWYLNLDIVPAGNEGFGLAGTIGADSWLPALPDGSSMGPMPEAAHDRFVALNQKFADAWRVTDTNSLFDYASGTSTKTFTDRNWPSEFPPCVVPGTTPEPPIAENLAKALSQGVRGGEFANCVYDVMVTGHPGFATTYALHQSVVANAAGEQNPQVSGPIAATWIWLLAGLLLGLLIALLIFLWWRKKTQP